MVTTELSTEKYFELTNKEQKLKKEGKNMIGEILNCTENKKNMKELLKWKVILESNIYFNNRESYFEVIENYLQEKGNIENFDRSLYAIWCQNRDQKKLFEEKLQKSRISTILVDSRADDYSDLINSFFSLNESLTDDEFYEISQEKHLKEVEKIYLAMKKVVQEK